MISKVLLSAKFMICQSHLKYKNYQKDKCERFQQLNVEIRPAIAFGQEKLCNDHDFSSCLKKNISHPAKTLVDLEN